MIRPSCEEAKALAGRPTVITLHKDLLGDLLTPAAAYLRVAHGRSRAFLLESVEGGERLARYSFVGWDPFLVVRGRGTTVETEAMGEAGVERCEPLEKLRQVSRTFRPAPVAGLPPFIGGGVGYFAYDFVRNFEKLPSLAVDELKFDDFHIMYFSNILAFDHLRHRIHLIVNILSAPEAPNFEAKYQDGVLRLEQIEKRLSAPISLPAPAAGENSPEPEANFDEAAYFEKVARVQAHIQAGDIFQAVLSRRLEMKVECDPFDIYRALRFINPSPYMFYLRMDRLCLAGSSPEMLVKVQDGRVEYGPIAGTRPRGANEEEDADLAAELLDDEKERAEHLMLVDLGRNDLGRICEFGTVEVTDLMRVERYSHVMHLVSRVEGSLRGGLDAFHALEACLPAGTVTGAPKIRAMEIIDALEPCRRGIYGGAVGYVDFSGNMDTCIALRTIVMRNGKAYIQAGGGIVADSEPRRELEESMNKASAMIRAVQFAHRGLR